MTRLKSFNQNDQSENCMTDLYLSFTTSLFTLLVVCRCRVHCSWIHNQWEVTWIELSWAELNCVKSNQLAMNSGNCTTVSWTVIAALLLRLVIESVIEVLTWLLHEMQFESKSAMDSTNNQCKFYDLSSGHIIKIKLVFNRSKFVRWCSVDDVKNIKCKKRLK